MATNKKFDVDMLRWLAKEVANNNDCGCIGREWDKNPNHDGCACWELEDEIPIKKWCLGCLMNELRNEAEKKK